MSARSFNGIFNADYACAADADDIALYSRLRDQVLKRCVKVERPLLFSCLTVAFLSTCFAVPANIDGQRVDSRRRELAGDHIPLLTSPVALMIQQNSRTGFCCGKVSCLQDCAVRCLQVNYARSRRLLRLWRRSYIRGCDAFCVLECPSHAETHNNVPIISWVSFAGSRAEQPGRIKPGATPIDAEAILSRFACPSIGRRIGVALGITVLCPLPNIAHHVVKAERVRRL